MYASDLDECSLPCVFFPGIHRISRRFVAYVRSGVLLFRRCLLVSCVWTPYHLRILRLTAYMAAMVHRPFLTLVSYLPSGRCEFESPIVISGFPLSRSDSIQIHFTVFLFSNVVLELMERNNALSSFQFACVLKRLFPSCPSRVYWGLAASVLRVGVRRLPLIPCFLWDNAPSSAS